MKNLTQEFERSAAAAHDAFPDKLKNLVVLSSGSKTPVYVAPAVEEALEGKDKDVKSAVKRISDTMVSMNAVGIAYPYFPLASVGTKMIGLRENPPGIYGERYTPEMRAIYVLDHEIGHHVVENGRGKGAHLGEVAADTFATLRHIQRYGMGSDLPVHMSKAPSMVFGVSPIHYTANATERAWELAKQQDITKLSLRETAELAAKIADECHLQNQRFYKLSAAFRTAAVAYAKKLGTPTQITDKFYEQDAEAYTLFIQKTIEAMVNNRDNPDVREAGLRLLKYPPVREFMKKAAKEHKGIFTPKKPEPAPAPAAATVTVTYTPSAQTPSGPA